MKKTLLLVISSILVFGLVGCADTSSNVPKDTVNTAVETPKDDDSTKPDAAGKDITLEDVNEFLNTSADLGPGTVVNPVAIIPVKHIDGPKNNIDVYAFVNFEYQGRDFVKYQVSYISCTCRPAIVNYWNTAYMEFSLPTSKDPNDVTLRYISYDDDAAGDYTGGLWGDSDPIPGSVTYQTIKEEYVPFFYGKDATFLKGLDTIDDIDLKDYQSGEGRNDLEMDIFTGATVSTNNTIRIINAMLDYHTQNEFFK